MKNKLIFLNGYFLVLYGILNIVVFLIFFNAFSNLKHKNFFIIGIALLYLLPIIVYKTKNYFLAKLGYLWMGFVIFNIGFFSVFTLLDMFTKSDVNVYLQSIFFGFFLTFYAYFRRKAILINKVYIECPSIKDGCKLLINQISDLHWGLFVKSDEIEKIANLSNQISPDIVIFSGDTVDAQGEINVDLIKGLKQFSAPLGKYAVLGNHESFFKSEQIMDAFHKAGIKVILKEAIDIGELVIYGISYGYEKVEQKMEDEMGKDKFKILVTHIPIRDKKLFNMFDIQIAGHTHGGQFFPINILTKLLFRYNYGLYNEENGKKIYVSSGAGTWLPPLRLFTRPEIVAFEFVGRSI